MLAPNENSWLSELFFGLSPEGRAVVSLYLVEGESVRGVPETLDLTPGEAEAWLEDGLRRIRDGLRLLGLSSLSEEEIAVLLKELPQPAPSPGFRERLLRLREEVVKMSSSAF